MNIENQLYKHRTKNHIVRVIYDILEVSPYQAAEDDSGTIPMIVAQRQIILNNDQVHNNVNYKPFAMNKQDFLEVYEVLK